MPNIFELAGAVYEASTVVTDVILNKEYIDRNWVEEYWLSIVLLVFNGVVMAVVGLGLDTEHPNRFLRSPVLNKAAGILVSILQLRVLAESVFTFAEVRKVERYLKRIEQQAQQIQQASQQNSNQQQLVQPEAPDEEYARALTDGLMYVVFIQGIVRDVPLFILQANATIHYRKWEFLDLWAVASTCVTLLLAVSKYVGKQDRQALGFTDVENVVTATKMRVPIQYAATFFLAGQFVFRLGAILLMATTTGYLVVYYAVGITVLGIMWSVVLNLAHPSASWTAQIPRTLLFFPFFTVFNVDASHLTVSTGDAREALFQGKLWVLNAWRVLENSLGVYLAVTRPRYYDFGLSKDEDILMAGVICGGVYLLSLIVFVITASMATKKEFQEDTTLYLHNAPMAPMAQYQHQAQQQQELQPGQQAYAYPPPPQAMQGTPSAYSYPVPGQANGSMGVPNQQYQPYQPQTQPTKL